jgi:hypothetical protein
LLFILVVFLIFGFLGQFLGRDARLMVRLRLIQETRRDVRRAGVGEG